MNTRIVVLALVMASAAPASAQWAVDGSVGFAVATHSAATTGLDLMVAVERRVAPVLPLAVRFEVGYTRLGLPAYLASQGENITRFALDAIVDPTLPGTPLRPYVLAGFGVYYVTLNSYSHADVGLNIGGGLRYPVGPVQPFFEVRYHVDYAYTAIGFVPFQFGVRIPIP